MPVATSQLTPDSFVRKWNRLFADNTFQNIKEATFREFAADIATVFGVPLENVPEYQPGITYQKGFLVRYTPAGGNEAFYYSKKAGVLSAPDATTTDWKVVPGPTTATALSQSITLLQAQGIQGSLVVAGRTYLLDLGPDANGNAQTISVRGISSNSFDVEGTLEVNGVITPITAIDVFAGTYQVKGTGGGGPGPAGSTYHTANFNAPADGVQTITTKEVPGLAQATDVIQVGIKAADGTLDPEFGLGNGYTFDVATHTLKVFAGDKAPGDYIHRDDALLIKWITGALTSAPGSPVNYADLGGNPRDSAPLNDELNALAPLRDPEFTGTPTAPNQPTAVAGNELVNAGWIRQLLASQLNLSPFASGGGRILHVCGRGQTTAGEAGNPNRPYASLPAAHNVAQAGDSVLVWPGGAGQDAFGRVYYTEAYTQTKPLSVYFLPGAIYGADIYAGNPGGSAPASHYFHGGEFLARILQARQAGGQSTLLVENAKFTGALGGVQYFANLSGGDGGPHVDQFTVRGSTFDSKRSAGNSAPIRNNGTQFFGDCDMPIDNCLVMTTETPCVIYSHRQGGSVRALGTTEFRPGPGQPALQALPPNGGGTAVPQANWFIDKRPAGGGATYTAGAGIAISAQNVLSVTNGITLFQGQTGDFRIGAGAFTPPSDQFVFVPLDTIPLDPQGGWDSVSRRYTIPVSGSYLVITKVLPAQGAQQGYTGRDFYCGPAVGTPGDNEDGNWEQVSNTSRRGIKISTAKHYTAGDAVGISHYQESGGYPILASMSIILLKAD